MAMKLKARTLAVRGAGSIDRETRAVIPPIHVSTTFVRDPDNAHRAGYSYSRDDNPTYGHVETLLAGLEGGAGALLFASGMAAATAVFQGLGPGDHVIAPKVMYWALRGWLMSMASDWGLEIELVDTTDLNALEKAVRPGKTKLLWVETPANPLWLVTDIAAAAGIAHAAGARLAVDSTVATPILSQPLSLGADIVMHSASKYLNGHSDVIAGALVTARDDEHWQRLKDIRSRIGGVLGPFEAAQLLRGMRTLHLRVLESSRSAQAIAERLPGHGMVSEVLYPGLADHPGHAVAARQMTGGFGGMLSIRVKGGESAAIATAARVEVWNRATSLGGVESLIEHRASVEGAGTPVPPDLLRLSVGIEDPGDLIADLENALDLAGLDR
jgi:cystathionine gamma-synthase